MVYNRGTLSQHYAPLKSYFELDLLAQNRYEIDLSNEVLKLILVKGLQKYQRSKLEVEIKSASLAPSMGASVSYLADSAIFFNL